MFVWLIEAPGNNYLSAHEIAHCYRFFWTTDNKKALQFFSESQANAIMMSVRILSPELFAFAANLGEARPVEHSWIAVVAEEDGHDQ